MVREVVLFALVAATAGSVGAEDTKTTDPLPPDATAVIQEVAACAARKDMEGVRARMADEFTWSFGGDSDADQATAEWAKDPRYLQELERVLRSSCKIAAPDRIECPRRAGLGFRAGFVKTDGTWRMSYFVEGD
jgi:hypothetical protein